MVTIINRKDEVEVFLDHLHRDDFARRPVLFIQGEAGIGKSVLLDFLREKVCYLRVWEEIKKDPTERNKLFVPTDKEIALEQVLTPFPVAYLDFSAPAKGLDNPQDAHRALMSLQRQLSIHGLRFPHFSYASLLYLSCSGQATDDVWKKGLPHDEITLVHEIVKLVHGGDVPFAGTAKAILKVGERLTGKDVGKMLRQRGLDEVEFQVLNSLDKRKPNLIADRLPRLFAEDLCRAITKSPHPKRVVLFLDSHDALWETGHYHRSDFQFFQRDAWVRGVLTALLSQPKIMIVVAGDERPMWDKAAEEPLTSGQFELVPLTGFEVNDARQYLTAAGVAEEEHDDLVKLASVDQGKHVHPLVLSLIAYPEKDVRKVGTPATVSNPRGSATRRGNALRAARHRILMYADQEATDAICAVSACLDFDFTLYEELGRKLKFDTSRARFERLVRFPFVRRVGDIDGLACYRIIDLLAMLLREEENKIHMDAHRFLYAWYKFRAMNNVAESEARRLHHLIVLDPEEGARQWAATQEALLAETVAARPINTTENENDDFFDD